MSSLTLSRHGCSIGKHGFIHICSRKRESFIKYFESGIIFVPENELDEEINSDDLIYADEFDELVWLKVIIVAIFFYIVVLQLNLEARQMVVD